MTPWERRTFIREFKWVVVRKFMELTLEKTGARLKVVGSSLLNFLAILILFGLQIIHIGLAVSTTDIGQVKQDEIRYIRVQRVQQIRS